MTTDMWDKIREIFADAIEIAPDERLGFIRKACGSNEEMVQEVLSLLAADANTHDMLKGRAVDLLEMPPEAPEDEQIGPYKLLNLLGVGGMGKVYLAQRNEGGFEQSVALKLVRNNLNSARAAERFRSERQILAKLQHPHIAQLYDGGLTKDGLPFFTMEYVDGIPVNDYCNQQRLSVKERLKLFLDICGAVHYAHQNLVVHRDIKPGNILVTADGQVKLLDFGIAKILTIDEEDALTREGERILTPFYASPEQILGKAVTTASDVYSLGAVLFQILTGKRPFQGDDTTPFSLQKQITEEDPPRPSTAISLRPPTAESDETSEVVYGPDIGEGEIRRQLAGDLDNICLMALRKEPDRRYESAAQLAADIENYLEKRPVRARPATWHYRATKFIARNMVATLISTLALLLLVSMAGYYTVNLRAERDKAQLEARKSAQISGFLSDLFDVSDPENSLGETITARELLDRGAREVEYGLEEQPGVQADMREEIGNVYRKLGLYDESEPLIRKSLEQRRELFGNVHQDVAESLASLGWLLVDQGKDDEAAEVFEMAQDIYGKLYGEDDIRTIGMKSLLGRVYSLQRKDSLALVYLEESYHEAKVILGEDNPELTGYMGDLASGYKNYGKYDEAEEIMRNVLAIRKVAYGSQDPRVSGILYRLGRLMYVRRDLPQADSLLQASYDIDLQIYGPDHPMVANLLQNMAEVAKSQRDYSRADSLFRECLDIRLRAYGEEHPLIATTKDYIARILRRQKRYDEALVLHREALDLKIQLLGREHPSVGNTLNNIGRALQYVGDFEGALEVTGQALAIYNKATIRTNPNAATVRHNYAKLLKDVGRYEESAPLFEESIETQRIIVGPEHRRVMDELNNLGYVRHQLQQYDLAIAAYREELALRIKTSKPGYWRIGRVQRLLGQSLAAAGKYDEAEEMLISAVEHLEPHRDEKKSAYEKSLKAAAEFFEQRGNTAKAASYRERLKGLEE